jgi:hypothetical protein
VILLRTPKTLTWCAVLLLTGVALWGWTVDPARPGRWLFIALFVPALWGYVEFAQGGERRRERAAIMDWHRIVFAWTGLVMASRVGVELAVATDWLDPVWGPIAQRARWIITGVSLAVWGNFLPKLLSPWLPGDEPFDWSRVHRFVGWLFSVAGVAVVGVWLVVPQSDQARLLSRVIFGTVAVLTVGRKLMSLASPPERHAPQTRRRPNLIVPDGPTR